MVLYQEDNRTSDWLSGEVFRHRPPRSAGGGQAPMEVEMAEQGAGIARKGSTGDPREATFQATERGQERVLGAAAHDSGHLLLSGGNFSRPQQSSG